MSCWIPDSFRKVLEFFESLYQPSGPVGKTKPAGSFGSVCWNGSLGGLIFFVLVLGYSESELNSVCLVEFLSLLGRFLNFLRVSINHLDRLGKPNQPVHLVQFAGTAVWVVWFVCVGSWLFGVGIELRLSCWIPDFVWKVLNIFEIFFQPSGPVGELDRSVCWVS